MAELERALYDGGEPSVFRIHKQSILSAPKERFKPKKVKHEFTACEQCDQCKHCFHCEAKQRNLSEDPIVVLSAWKAIDSAFKEDLVMHTIGKESEEPLHLIPSANLVIDPTPSKRFERAWRSEIFLKQKDIYSGFGHEIKIYIQAVEFPDWIRQLPDWIRQSSDIGSTVSFNLPPNVSHNLLAVILCFKHWGVVTHGKTPYSVENTTSGFTWRGSFDNYDPEANLYY
ncbi:hypothetical protein POM88_020120 [Heracleum sosnowskyi]|uniref:Uncharacterized protein n=1 Tax=Heracleum sosnowskyi TaxID=360622 RepID=A0AAD8IBB8_9APIA|nr:hypothetical protein POM88_020120 [Heracleum sosnowskyi]